MEYEENREPGFWETAHRQLVESDGEAKVMIFFMTFLIVGIPLILLLSGGC